MPSALAAGALAPTIGPPLCRRAVRAQLHCLETSSHVMPGITSNELILPTAHAAQQTKDVGEHLFNHLTAARFLSMMQRIPRIAPYGQPRNTGMISSVEGPSADPAKQPRIVSAAVRIHDSAVLNQLGRRGPICRNSSIAGSTACCHAFTRSRAGPSLWSMDSILR